MQEVNHTKMDREEPDASAVGVPVPLGVVVEQRAVERLRTALLEGALDAQHFVVTLDTYDGVRHGIMNERVSLTRFDAFPLAGFIQPEFAIDVIVDAVQSICETVRRRHSSSQWSRSDRVLCSFDSDSGDDDDLISVYVLSADPRRVEAVEVRFAVPILARRGHVFRPISFEALYKMAIQNWMWFSQIVHPVSGKRMCDLT